MSNFLLLSLLGLSVGTFGTMIGAGGGFILVPMLLIMFPFKSPEEITSISLAVVFFNALSGSIAYSRMKRIDFKSGLFFSAATIPGSIAGSIAVAHISRYLFNLIFGILLLLLGIYLFFQPQDKNNTSHGVTDGLVTRKIKDVHGCIYTYSYHRTQGLMISLVVGFISSLLGIGGGIIHVPALVHLLNFPVHIATATSHFVLAIMALSGSAIHYFSGSLTPSLFEILFLSCGAIIGAQLGAKLSQKLHDNLIIKSLAVALSLVGLRILLMAF